MNNVFFLVMLTYALVGFLLPTNILCMYATGLGLIIINAKMIGNSLLKQNFPMFFISIFIMSYCVEPLGYLFGFKQHIIRITTAENTDTVFFASHCLLFFLLFLSTFIKYEVPNDVRLVKQTILVENQLGFWLALSIAFLCVILGVSGKNIFESGGYGRGESARSSVFEYSIIFITCALIYARKSNERFLVYFICFIFVIKDLLYGGRISTVMLLISIFLIRFFNNLKFKHVLLAVAFGYIFLNFWGYFRSGVDSSGFTLSKKDGNASFVFYASMRLHYMIDIGALTLEDRLKSLVYFFMSIFVPSNFLPGLANLSSYKQNLYYSGGGGLISTFSYCWGWAAGVGFFALWVVKVVNSFFYSNSVYWKYYALLVIVSTPRWFAYYPIQIFKFALYGVLIFYILNSLIPKTINIENEK